MTSRAIGDAEDVAETGVKQTVHRYLTAAHGQNALTEMPISDDFPTLTKTVPAEFLQGIVAARRVEQHAKRLIIDYATNARAEGTPWADLAVPLGIALEADGTGPDPGCAAFEAVAWPPSQPYDPQHVYWRCTACRERVDDRGPYNGHPADDEQGHAETCPRHLADLAEFRARDGFDDDDD